MTYRLRLAACLLVVGCGGGGAGDDDGDDAAAPDASLIDATVDAGDDLGWIEGYEQEVIGKLAGAQPIAPGTTLTARASVSERDATRTYLIAELLRWGYTAELYDYGTGQNVIATLPATTAGDGMMVIAGAHFDGVAAGPAAADDGTGTALVLAAARYFATVADRPRPMTFAFFDQEEIGLVGSQNWADHLVQDAVPVAEMHNFDMISWDGDGDGAIELWSPSPSMEAKYRAHAGAIPIAAVTFEYSDHQAFLNDGFVATGVGEEFNSGDHTPHYHMATDTYDKINFPYLVSITRLAFDVLADQ
jgi:hypothetical protein